MKLGLTLTLACAALSAFAGLGCASTNDTTGNDTTGAGAAGGAGGAGGGAPGVVFTALVRGTLKDDVAGSKALHDKVVGGARKQSMADGDVGHEPLLNKDAQPGSPLAFLSIDRWTSLDGFEAFVASPPVVDFIGAFYAGAPDVSVWTARPGWTTWGSAADESPRGARYVITLRGHYAGDAAAAMKTHNAIVAGIPAPGAVALGNTAHMLFATPKDDSELLVIEVWTNQKAQEQTYMALGPQIAKLWDGMPDIERWDTTDWTRW